MVNKSMSKNRFLWHKIIRISYYTLPTESSKQTIAKNKDYVFDYYNTYNITVNGMYTYIYSFKKARGSYFTVQYG